MVEILSHAAEVKIVSPKGIDMLAHERRGMAYRLVIELVPFSPQLSENPGNLNHIPRHHGIVQNRKGTEGVELIAKSSAAQHPLLAEA